MSTKKAKPVVKASSINLSELSYSELNNLLGKLQEERLENLKKKFTAKEIKAWKKKIDNLHLDLSIPVTVKTEISFLGNNICDVYYPTLEIQDKVMNDPKLNAAMTKIKTQGKQVEKELKKLAKTYKVEYYNILELFGADF